MKKFVSFLLAFVMLLALTACGEGGLSLNGSNSNDKEGYIGDTLSTYWFDFTVDDAYSCSSYHDYTASAGKKLVVASITLKNTCGTSVDMWGDDFVILWDTGDDDVDMEFALPGGLSDKQFPDEYTLGINQSKSYEAVYEVHEGYRDFAVAFMEIFESDSDPDGEAGETYFVYFTPEEK